MINVTDQAHGADWSFYNADTVDAIQGIPDASVGLSVYSPPFANVFTYSDLNRDMGNCASDQEFMEHYAYIIGELRRVTMPGRLSAVHCRDLLALQSKEGFQGLKDFPGWIIQAHIDAGWTYHSRITVWKDPVVEMQRTKAHGLLYKTLQADSSRSRQGCADYLLIFRRRPEGDEEVSPVTQDGSKFPVTQWQEWASPVWMTINQCNVLNVAEGRSEQDERHMCIAEGSMVLTYRGYIKIQDVTTCDLVLTHDGNWRRVTAKSCNGTREIIKVEAQGVPNLMMTPEHPMWMRRGGGNKSRQKMMRSAPEWARADSTLASYVNLKLPPAVNSNLTADEWWIVGRWLGDGHTDTRGRFHISCAYDKTAALVAKMGVRAGHVGDTNTCNHVAVKDADCRLHSILDRCGRGAVNKVVPGDAMCLDSEKSAALLDGYLSSDGHYVEKYRRWTSSSISRALVLGMAVVAQRVYGVAVSVYAGRKGGKTTILGREVTTHDDWVMSIPPKNISGAIMDDGAWKKVRKITSAGESVVWDLQVEGDHSFVVEGCAVHNCPLQLDLIERAIKLWSNPGETIFSPFGGIASEGVGALRAGRKFVGIELKPEYWKVGCDNLKNATAQMGLGF